MEKKSEAIKFVDCKDYSPTFNKMEGFRSDCLYRAEDNGNCGYCKKEEWFRCIMDVAMMPIPLSQSTVGDFVICPYLYYLKNIRGIVVKDSQMSAAVKMGKLWDSVLQADMGDSTISLKQIIDDYEIPDINIAKVKALFRAYKALGITIETGGVLQAEFDNTIEIPGIYSDYSVAVKIKGFFDRKYDKYFVENKLSSRPDNYLDPFFIQSQVGAYFLSDDKLEYCIMEVARVPDLKSIGKFKDEAPEEHEERCYQDIISRPAFYFLGWDKDSRMYGKKYRRGEFDIDGIKKRFRAVDIMIHDLQAYDGWYKNDKACGAILPGIPCDMKSICRYGNMSETMYEVKKKRFSI